MPKHQKHEKQPQHKYGPMREKGTNWFIWGLAIICAVLSVAVIIAGVAVFIGYIIVHPRVPFISVVGASLDIFWVDPAGILVSQVTINIKAENDNLKAHASFQKMDLVLGFSGLDIARLRADPFDVMKNDSRILQYVVQSYPISLDPDRTQIASDSLQRDQVQFDLKGTARAQWRVGFLGSLKFWCHLDCHLQFHPGNHTYANAHRCTSRGK